MEESAVAQEDVKINDGLPTVAQRYELKDVDNQMSSGPLELNIQEPNAAPHLDDDDDNKQPPSPALVAGPSQPPIKSQDFGKTPAFPPAAGATVPSTFIPVPNQGLPITMAGQRESSPSQELLDFFEQHEQQVLRNRSFGKDSSVSVPLVIDETAAMQQPYPTTQAGTIEPPQPKAANPAATLEQIPEKDQETSLPSAPEAKQEVPHPKSIENGHKSVPQQRSLGPRVRHDPAPAARPVRSARNSKRALGDDYVETFEEERGRPPRTTYTTYKAPTRRKAQPQAVEQQQPGFAASAGGYKKLASLNSLHSSPSNNDGATYNNRAIEQVDANGYNALEPIEPVVAVSPIDVPFPKRRRSQTQQIPRSSRASINKLKQAAHGTLPLAMNEAFITKMPETAVQETTADDSVSEPQFTHSGSDSDSEGVNRRRKRSRRPATGVKKQTSGPRGLDRNLSGGPTVAQKQALMQRIAAAPPHLRQAMLQQLMEQALGPPDSSANGSKDGIAANGPPPQLGSLMREQQQAIVQRLLSRMTPQQRHALMQLPTHEQAAVLQQFYQQHILPQQQRSGGAPLPPLPPQQQQQQQTQQGRTLSHEENQRRLVALVAQMPPHLKQRLSMLPREEQQRVLMQLLQQQALLRQQQQQQGAQMQGVDAMPGGLGSNGIPASAAGPSSTLPMSAAVNGAGYSNVQNMAPPISTRMPSIPQMSSAFSLDFNPPFGLQSNGSMPNLGDPFGDQFGLPDAGKDGLDDNEALQDAVDFFLTDF